MKVTKRKITLRKVEITSSGSGIYNPYLSRCPLCDSSIEATPPDGKDVDEQTAVCSPNRSLTSGLDLENSNDKNFGEYK